MPANGFVLRIFVCIKVFHVVTVFRHFSYPQGLPIADFIFAKIFKVLQKRRVVIIFIFL